MSRKGGVFKFLAGIGVGVGAGMLLAPKSGEELRKELKVKMNKLVDDAKEIDVKEVVNDFMEKIDDLKHEIEELDKEKVLEIAKEKGEMLKNKANDLFELAKEKGTPVLEKSAEDVRKKAVLVTKEVLKKLEKAETK